MSENKIGTMLRTPIRILLLWRPDVGDQSYPPMFDYGNAYDRKDAGLHIG